MRVKTFITLCLDNNIEVAFQKPDVAWTNIKVVFVHGGNCFVKRLIDMKHFSRWLGDTAKEEIEIGLHMGIY